MQKDNYNIFRELFFLKELISITTNNNLYVKNIVMLFIQSIISRSCVLEILKCFFLIL